MYHGLDLTAFIITTFHNHSNHFYYLFWFNNLPFKFLINFIRFFLLNKLVKTFHHYRSVVIECTAALPFSAQLRLFEPTPLDDAAIDSWSSRDL